MSDYLELREQCCEGNRRLAEMGIVDITFGNLSVVDREAGVMAIKPSGVDYAVLKPEHIVVMDVKAKPDEEHKLDLTAYRIWGDLRPSSDTPTHIKLYQAFENIACVVHTHSRNATAFAQAGREVPCLGTTHADYFYGPVPVTRQMTAEEIERHYEWETGEVIVETFKGLNPDHVPSVLVRNHAPFVWGPSMNKTLETAFALEVIAEMTSKSLFIDPQATPVSRAQLDKHFWRKHGSSAYYGQS